MGAQKGSKKPAPRTEIIKKEDAKTVRQQRRVKVDKNALNPKQFKFVEYYLIDAEPKAAYIRAFGPSARASSHAAQLLKLPKVQAAIAKKQKTLADRLGITQEFVLRELKAIASFNIENYITVDSEGQAVIDFSAMERDHAASIQGVTSKRYYDKDAGSMVTETTLKPWNKQAALELLGKYVGIRGFGTNKLEITGADGGPIEVENIHTLDERQLALIVAQGSQKTIEGVL